MSMEINFPFALLLTSLAGLSTVIGSSIAFFIKRPRYSHLTVLLSFSGGVMIYIAFTELLGTAIIDVGFITANIAFFIGILLIAVVDILLPHEYKEEQVTSPPPSFAATEQQESSGSHLTRFEHRRQRARYGLPQRAIPSKSALKRSGILLAVGIAIHNFPEGVVTFTCAATGDIAFGIMIAVAIALHNIPEGIAVSVPIFYATGNRLQAFGYSFLSGVAEPVGALIGYGILFPFLTPALLSSILAFAAGVMIYISLDEILPLAHRYGREHLVIIGLGSGMAVMAVSLFLLG